MADNHVAIFFSSPDGEKLLHDIQAETDRTLRKGMKQPDLARDYAQRACGMDDIVLMIKARMVSKKVKKVV